MRVMLADQVADLDYSQGREVGLQLYWEQIQALLERVGPMYMSTKLDGVRGAIADKVMSRTWKEIRSKAIQEVFAHTFLGGLDGEFIAGDPTDSNAMQAANSATSKADSAIIPHYYAFDCYSKGTEPFSMRYEYLKAFERELDDMPVTDLSALWKSHVHVVEQHLVSTGAEVRAYLEKFLSLGYEGGMLRLPTSPYKQGRSTRNEAYLLKVKIWEDAEAEVLDVYEAMHNTNVQERDDRGYSKRSSAKSGLVPAGYLGGFHVRDIKSGVEFDIGIAVRGVWSREIRTSLWHTADQLHGKLLTYRHFPSGIVDKPRFPKFVSWRSRDDI